MATAPTAVEKRELLSLVGRRAEHVRAFLDWANAREKKTGWSMRLAARDDIPDAEEAASAFPEAWWGHVVFSCFGSVPGTLFVAKIVAEPLSPEHAAEVLPHPRTFPGG